MTPQYGPHRWSAGDREIHQTDAFRGASFTVADLTGARFRDCDLSSVKIVDSWLVDVNVSGFVRNLVVNDVDVTAYVEAEVDRRHPERVQLRQLRTAEDYRAMWDTIERLWSATVARAERLPEPVRHERVEDEWSFVETMRHLVFATDAWASRTVLDEPMPYQRLGLPQTAYPPADAAALGMDLGADPSFTEVMLVRAGRLAVVRRIVDGLTDADLERVCTRAPAPGYPEETRTVGSCLGVVMKEECEHHRYAVRDLAVLEARQQSPDTDAKPVRT
jgi:DinB superfamily/Pentapeptide repeats (8 copies)